MQLPIEPEILEVVLKDQEILAPIRTYVDDLKRLAGGLYRDLESLKLKHDVTCHDHATEIGQKQNEILRLQSSLAQSHDELIAMSKKNSDLLNTLRQPRVIELAMTVALQEDLSYKIDLEETGRG